MLENEGRYAIIRAIRGNVKMNCPKCRTPTTKRGSIEKVRVLRGTIEKFEIDVIVISCVKCRTILGIVNAPQT